MANEDIEAYYDGHTDEEIADLKGGKIPTVTWEELSKPGSDDEAGWQCPNNIFHFWVEEHTLTQ